MIWTKLNPHALPPVGTLVKIVTTTASGSPAIRWYRVTEHHAIPETEHRSYVKRGYIMDTPFLVVAEERSGPEPDAETTSPFHYLWIWDQAAWGTIPEITPRVYTQMPLCTKETI